MRPRRHKRQMSEINVVPYIDVMLVLLVIFMVTAPLLMEMQAFPDLFLVIISSAGATNPKPALEESNKLAPGLCITIPTKSAPSLGLKRPVNGSPWLLADGKLYAGVA